MKKLNIGKIAGLAMAVAIWIGASTSANGALVFTGTGVNLNAAPYTSLAGKATFTLNGAGTILTLLLENTGADAVRNSDVMTGILFNSVVGSLTPVSASGTVINPETGGNTLGGGWVYNTSGNGATGLGIWGDSNPSFDGAHHNHPPLNGNDYGIVNGLATGHSVTGSGGVTPPLALDSVLFTFNVGTGFDLSAINSVSFVYGTGTEDDTYVLGSSPGAPVPEPSTVIAGALLLLPFGASTIRILRKNRAA